MSDLQPSTGSADLPSIIELMVAIRKYWTTASGEPELKEFAQYVQDLMRQRDPALLQKIEEAMPKKGLLLREGLTAEDIAWIAAGNEVIDQVQNILNQAREGKL